jgi:hypothetical protein
MRIGFEKEENEMGAFFREKKKTGKIQKISAGGHKRPF